MFDGGGLKRLTKLLLGCIKCFSRLTHLMLERVEEGGTSTCLCPVLQRRAHGLTLKLYVSNTNHDAPLGFNLLFPCHDGNRSFLLSGSIILRLNGAGEDLDRL